MNLVSGVLLKSRKHSKADKSIVAYLDGLPPSLRYGELRQTKVNALRELQSTSGEELRRSRTLMASVLDRAFKGEL
jgi:hypothetical protein